jgi:hypothetical protein
MDAGIEAQRLQIGVQAIQKIASQPVRLPLVEMIPFEQVLLRESVKVDSHVS